MTRSKRVLSAALVGAAALATMIATEGMASAQDDQRGVITLAEVTITGRIQKPIAAVDVNRIAPKLTLGELRQPFLTRIEKVLYSDPY